MGSDTALTERLSQEALGRNLRPRRAATSAEARRLAAAETPDAVVLDVSFAEDRASDDLGLLEDLSSRRPPVPVVVLTGSDALLDRVEVAPRGGRGFLLRTRPARQVIDMVNEVIAQRDRSDTRVLALDDDPAISAPPRCRRCWPPAAWPSARSTTRATSGRRSKRSGRTS